MATVNFSEQVNNFATRVGAECKRISNTIGALSSLNTSDKTSVVAAIAEVKTATATLQNTLNSYSTELNGVKTQQSTNTGDLTTLNEPAHSCEAVGCGDYVVRPFCKHMSYDFKVYEA